MKHIVALCRWAREEGLEMLTLSELARRVLGRTDGVERPARAEAPRLESLTRARTA
jgi:hypothetical protein